MICRMTLARLFAPFARAAHMSVMPKQKRRENGRRTNDVVPPFRGIKTGGRVVLSPDCSQRRPGDITLTFTTPLAYTPCSVGPTYCY
jgi:hypothetical protein